MSTIINADTSDGLKFTSDTSGEIKLQSAGTDIVSVTANGMAVDTNTLYVDATNNRVGIGTSIPTTNLTIVPSSVANGIDIIADPSNSTRSGRLFFTNDTAGEAISLRNDAASLLFATGATAGSSSGTERMRLDDNGDVAIGTSTAGARLRIRGAGTTSATDALRVDDSSGAIMFMVRDDGRIYSGTSSGSPANLTTANAANMYVSPVTGILFRSTSSLKYKTDVQDATHGLDDVMKLRAVTYKGKTDGDTVFGGLIAEEVHDAGLTEFVQYDDEGNPDALAYGHMVSLAFKAIQELKTENDTLKSQLSALETRIEALENA